MQPDSKNNGWIKLHRNIEKWPLYFVEPFTKAHAWIDMLLLANHATKTIDIRGNIIEIKRGQIGWSEQKLADRWLWSRMKVRRYLTWLETRQQTIQQKSAVLSLITICNYEKYQQNDTTDDTTEKQQTIQQTSTNKKEKNENNEKNILPKAKYLDFVLLTEKEHKKLIDQIGEVETKKAIERLNNYIGSTGKKYKSHYFTILNWSRREEQKAEKPKYISPVFGDNSKIEYGKVNF